MDTEHLNGPVRSCSPHAVTLPGKPVDPSQLEEIDSVINDIQAAEFVALDFEFSGLYGQYYRREHELETYFNACADNARRFSILQLGICAARRSQSNPKTWILSPYNFYCLPSRRTVFSSDTKTLQWLRDNGFDFHEWLKTGYDYMQLAKLQSSEMQHRPISETVRETGLQRIIQTIIEYDIPLVLHNGLFDLLHICDKFIGDIPKPMSRFCGEILRLFAGGVYDTKHIATQGLRKIFHIPGAAQASTNLQDLRSHLMTMQITNDFEISDHRKCFVDERHYSLRPADSNGLHSNAHEAGFDALATAQTFLMELELIFKYVRQQSPEPATKSSTPNSLPKAAQHDAITLTCDATCATSDPSDASGIPTDANMGQQQSNGKPGGASGEDCCLLPVVLIPPVIAIEAADTLSTNGVLFNDESIHSFPPSPTKVVIPSPKVVIPSPNIQSTGHVSDGNQESDSDEDESSPSTTVRSPDSCKRRKILNAKVKNRSSKSVVNLDVDVVNLDNVKNGGVDTKTRNSVGTTIQSDKTQSDGGVENQGNRRTVDGYSDVNSANKFVSDDNTTGNNVEITANAGFVSISISGAGGTDTSVQSRTDDIKEHQNNFLSIKDPPLKTDETQNASLVPFGWSKSERWWDQFVNALGVPVFPGVLNFVACAPKE